MDVVNDLALTDSLCARRFPAARDGTGPAPGGPGYFLVVLEAAGGGTPADLYAHEAALTERFEERWGEGARWGSVTLLERAARGEEIPEPWAELGLRADDLRTWREPGTGRWISLAVADRDPDADPALLLMVTDRDPP
ncbi:hypothetical protein F8R89_05430 [Streptomyces sp. SS1-1]|uniref:hypothetical protein n=1 Tax=Streptomyces sp. SS1-1 TaxID=2651869 RepID=UPI001250AAA6|nr:hypothetical protein [Streptomyces sp. SS1-1]KAB2971538.1 hypothetical protein F8R89_05430 [Streptomyces sp. SS1-1]